MSLDVDWIGHIKLSSWFNWYGMKEYHSINFLHRKIRIVHDGSFYIFFLWTLRWWYTGSWDDYNDVVQWMMPSTFHASIMHTIVYLPDWLKIFALIFHLSTFLFQFIYRKFFLFIVFFCYIYQWKNKRRFWTNVTQTIYYQKY